MIKLIITKNFKKDKKLLLEIEEFDYDEEDILKEYWKKKYKINIKKYVMDCY